MYPPKTSVSTDETTEQIVEKIHSSGRYNIPVIENGKYLGFVSRASIFSFYQKK
ncbi:MAG: CBS domain-containing protein [Bacteroidales bacterium]|nr:CBS domain-containing protein [Bacteroidales bacterium]